VSLRDEEIRFHSSTYWLPPVSTRSENDFRSDPVECFGPTTPNFSVTDTGRQPDVSMKSP
jgi:hypothetical protein